MRYVHDFFFLFSHNIDFIKIENMNVIDIVRLINVYNHTEGDNECVPKR